MFIEFNISLHISSNNDSVHGYPTFVRVRVRAYGTVIEYLMSDESHKTATPFVCTGERNRAHTHTPTPTYCVRANNELEYKRAPTPIRARR